MPGAARLVVDFGDASATDLRQLAEQCRGMAADSAKAERPRHARLWRYVAGRLDAIRDQVLGGAET